MKKKTFKKPAASKFVVGRPLPKKFAKSALAQIKSTPVPEVAVSMAAKAAEILRRSAAAKAANSEAISRKNHGISI